MDEDTFTVDWAYIKREAREALRSYFAPLWWPAAIIRWAVALARKI